jgi:hypothetical protein
MPEQRSAQIHCKGIQKEVLVQNSDINSLARKYLGHQRIKLRYRIVTGNNKKFK